MCIHEGEERWAKNAPVDEGLHHLPPLLLGFAHSRRALLLRARAAPRHGDVPAPDPAPSSSDAASTPLERSGRRAAAAAEDGRLRGDPRDAPGRGLHPPPSLPARPQEEGSRERASTPDRPGVPGQRGRCGGNGGFCRGF